MEKWMVGTAFSEDNIQVILVILIVIFSAISAVVKKINAWVKTHRLPTDKNREDPSARPHRQATSPTAGSSQTPSKLRLPSIPAQAQAAPQKVQSMLLKELEKALGGGELIAESAPRSAPPLPSYEKSAPPPPLPEKDDLVAQMRSQAALRTTSDGKKVSSTGVVIHDAAVVHRAQVGHLAVLRNPQDLQKAVLLHEILSPPRSKRPMTPRGAAPRPA